MGVKTGVGDKEGVKVLPIPSSQRPLVTPVEQAGFNTIVTAGKNAYIKNL